ncbi:MAG: hypothetical protein NTU53_21705 [Planctomycetota bacterium]|nr:hypothetical protein [Planctomycetota bacterium]
MPNPLNILRNLFRSKPQTPEAPRQAEAPAAPAIPPAAPPDTSAEAPPAPPIENQKSKIKNPPHSFLHLLNEFRIRVHAFAVLLIVSFAGYLAVTYLMHTVFMQPPVPTRFLDWQGRNDAAALRSSSAAGLTTSAERAPLAHYHRTRPWFQPDPRNGCTVSGCHDPLPHTRKQKVPAFANFHATFLACQMCHAPADGGPTAVTWVNITSAQRQPPPAMLQLLRYLDTFSELIPKNPAEAHAAILPLLRGTLTILGDDPALSTMLLQIETSEPGSPVWRQAVDQLTYDLPSYARGEYGAKLAREPQPGSYQETSRTLRNLAQRYLANYSDVPHRKQLHSEIHGSLLKEPVTCLPCHGDSPATLNYESLGYSPRRAKLLGNLQLARLMQQIRQGEQFHLPKLLGSDDAK